MPSSKTGWYIVETFVTKAPASEFVRIYKAQGEKARVVKTNKGYEVQLYVVRPYTRAGERGAVPNSDNVRELVLFIDNDGDLYRRQTTSIMKNLAKKMVKGTYDPAKAVKLWKYLADAGAKKYTKEFDSPGGPNGSFGAFSPADRQAAAVELAEAFDSAVRAGDFDVEKLAKGA